MKNTTLDNQDQIQAFKLYGLWKFLKLELETGLKMTRYSTAFKQVKDLTGWTGSKKKVYTIFTQYLACIEVITFDQMREVKAFVGKDYFNKIDLRDYCEIV